MDFVQKLDFPSSSKPTHYFNQSKKSGTFQLVARCAIVQKVEKEAYEKSKK